MEMLRSNNNYNKFNSQYYNRGDVFYCDLGEVIGSEQGGIRPVIIIQNDSGNKYSPTVIIASITSQINKAKLPTHVEISTYQSGLNKDSVILFEQVRTIDKKRLKEKICHFDELVMERVDEAIMISLGLKQPVRQQIKHVDTKELVACAVG